MLQLLHFWQELSYCGNLVNYMCSRDLPQGCHALDLKSQRRC